MSLSAILSFGFFLGMRHAIDPDHVLAVSAIVSRQRTLRAAAPIGILWGIGHTVTIVLVGGAILVFGLVVPPRLGLGMELSAAVMLIALGTLNVRQVLEASKSIQAADTRAPAPESAGVRASLRPLWIGLVHGLAGSAALALVVLGTIRDPWWGMSYLVVFGLGTIAGMLLVTAALAMPIAVAAQRFERFHRALGVATGLMSIAFGAMLVYEIGFVHGLFTGNPHWSPE